MKAIEQYVHVVLFIMLYKVVLAFKSVDETLVWVTIQIKAIRQYFREALIMILCKMVSTCKSVEGTLN